MGQILSEGFACINSFQLPCGDHKPILQMGNPRRKVHSGIGWQSWDSNQAVSLQSLCPEPLPAGCLGEKQRERCTERSGQKDGPSALTSDAAVPSLRGAAALAVKGHPVLPPRPSEEMCRQPGLALHLSRAPVQTDRLCSIGVSLARGRAGFAGSPGRQESWL